eukprot:jgi/Botrbrau1/2494/Bobra.0226s0050.1
MEVQFKGNPSAAEVAPGILLRLEHRADVPNLPFALPLEFACSGNRTGHLTFEKGSAAVLSPRLCPSPGYPTVRRVVSSLNKMSHHSVTSSEPSTISRVSAGPHATAVVRRGAEDVGTSEPEAMFRHMGNTVHVRLSQAGLHFSPAATNCIPLRPLPELIPFEEILGVREGSNRLCCCSMMFHLEVTTFWRKPRRRCEWRLQRYKLHIADLQLVEEWVSVIRGALKELRNRPRTLLVIINPYGGARKAGQVWDRIAQPVLHLTGACCDVRETIHEKHATKMVTDLTLADLERYDGIIAVGGDGLFQEILNGSLQ